jgi:hypothetical protein
MTSKQLSIAFLAPLLLAGCNGALIGNLLVVGLSVGIFFGTLSLGRTSSGATRSGADSSQSSAK